MANTINPSTPFFRWKMAIVTKSTDDWTTWNCDERYERTLFIGIHDDLENPYAALYLIYKGKPQPAAGNAILADLASMQVSINTALQELQALIDQVNATTKDMQDLQAQVAAILVQMEDKLVDMQQQIAKARAWAEGTDAEVTALGGQHSSKTWAGIAKQAADQATGAAFPTLADGDQGKALVVNDAADGYTLEEISGGNGSGFGTAGITDNDANQGGIFSFTEDGSQLMIVQYGVTGIVPDGYNEDGSIALVSDRLMKNQRGTIFTANSIPADCFLYLVALSDGSVRPLLAPTVYTFLSDTKPSGGAYGYWMDTANNKCWRVNANGSMLRASAPIAFIRRTGVGTWDILPFGGFSVMPGPNGSVYVLVGPKTQIQYPWGNGKGQYAHGDKSPGMNLYSFGPRQVEFPSGLESYAYLAMQFEYFYGTESIVGYNQMGFDAYANLYKENTVAIQDKPTAYLGCWLDEDFFPKSVQCNGGALPIINFVQNIQNVQSSSASSYEAWKNVEVVTGGKPTLGQYQRALYGKIFYDVDSEKYYRAQYATAGEGVVPAGTPFDNATYWKDVTPAKVSGNNTWTGDQTFVMAVNAKSASYVDVPYVDIKEATDHFNAVNIGMLLDGVATREMLNKGVDLLPPASTWDFWQETDGSVTTLNKTTGIASGFTANAYLRSNKTLDALGVTDFNSCEIILRVKCQEDSETYNLWNTYPDGGLALSNLNVLRNSLGTNDDTGYYGAVLTANTWTYIKLTMAGGVVSLAFLADANGQYSLATLPTDGWTVAEYTKDYGAVQNGFLDIGGVRYPDAYCRAEIDLLNTKMTFGNVTVWDGSTVVLSPFAGKVSTVGSVTLNETNGIASGFSNGSYLKLETTALDGYGYDMIFRVYQNGASGRGAILSWDSSDGNIAVTEVGLQDTTPYTYQNSQTLCTTSPVLDSAVWNWVRFKKSSSSVDVYVLADAREQYTLDTLPELDSWVHSGTTGSLELPSAGRTLYIGRSFADASYYLHGSIDMFNTRITFGDTLWYDGAVLASKSYGTVGTHQQSTGRIGTSVILRRFEADSKVYMELDGMFEGTVAADNTITIDTSAYSFKGTLISLQALPLGTGTVTLNYNSTSVADMANGTITLRTNLAASEAYKVSVHCVIEQIA